MSDSQAEEVAIDEEMHEHLDHNNRGFLVTRRADGSPTCHPMGSYYADRQLCFNMYASSAKHKNLLRDPRTTVLVTTPSDSQPLQALFVRGQARLLPTEEIVAADAPPVVVKARAMGLEGVTKESEAPEKFAREEPTDLKKRVAVMMERIRDGVRVVWEIMPSEIHWAADARTVKE